MILIKQALSQTKQEVGGEEKIFWVGVQMSKNMLLSVKQTFTE